MDIKWNDEDKEYVVIIRPQTVQSLVVTDAGEKKWVNNEYLYEEDSNNINMRRTFWGTAIRIFYDDHNALIRYYAGSLSKWKALVAGAGKKCNSCNTHKPFTEFYARTERTDGLSNMCKGCKIEADAAAYINRMRGRK